MLIIGCILLKLIDGTITRGLISGSSGAPNENIVQNHLNIAF